MEGDKRTAVPGEPSKFDGPDACSANASHAMDADGVDRGTQSELWVPANQVPSTEDSSPITRCDAIKERRSGGVRAPAKRCAASLLRCEGVEDKKPNERLGELDAEDADACQELEDEAPARTDSQTIEGMHSSVSSGCPN